MAKVRTPSFIIDVELKGQNRDFLMIESELEINRVIYNTSLGEYLKREKQMKRTKRYKKLVRISRAIKSHLAKNSNKEKMEYFQNEQKNLSKEFKILREEFGLTEYSMHEYIKEVRNHFNGKINSIIAQKTATRAWNTVKKKLFGKAKKVVFVKRGEMDSFEGKNNDTGWRFKEGKVISNYRVFVLKVKKMDIYLKEAFHLLNSQQIFQYKNKDGETVTDFYRVKYVRIIKRIVRGIVRYYAQLVCTGYPPVKRDRKTGKVKYPLGNGPVGTDIGTSSIAVSSKSKILLKNLAENIKKVEHSQREIRLYNRKLDRSKRATNPQNFDEAGRIRKGKKQREFSNNYKKLKAQLKDLYRKLALYRKLSHQYEVNRMVMLGDRFFLEEMNFKALQKRAKKTEVSEKTGKYKKKKRFGKTIARRSPAAFVSILSRKVTALGGTLIKVKTSSFKASQYDHKADKCKKKELKERWHRFDDGTKVQRDLYSAFLLMNSDLVGLKSDRISCLNSFEQFFEFHKEEIKKIENDNEVILNSGIKLKENRL
ncbi:transposase [Neobacillus sp. YX16]|uniref:transposase n=1 Tax=Neobacillus sp. YX16 TaxID=3047874 RepID=UPI0024C2F0D9|nr:transposase [Neobacillus sp. YX16]WHZ01949.1 transposase [Neobacillus sp. YX16]